MVLVQGWYIYRYLVEIWNSTTFASLALSTNEVKNIIIDSIPNLIYIKVTPRVSHL